MAVDGAEFAHPNWLDPSWQARILAWAAAELERTGHPVRGDAEQRRAYPWSTVFRIPTVDGAAWLKANNSGTAYEAPLLAALARWCPDRVLVPIAVDESQGWILMPDGGQTLRQAQDGHTDLAHWERILVEYGELQRLLADRSDELVALGVPDSRPGALARSRAGLLGDPQILMVGRPGGATAEQCERLRADAAEYERLCAELAATGVPASLQHDDLHDANVFVAPQHYRVFDWGDSSVAHPFLTLLVSLRVVAHQMNLDPGAPELLRLRDVYLEGWTADFDSSTLREAAGLACRVGSVSRALSYARALTEATPRAQAEYGDAVPGWLLEYYEPTPLEPTPSGPATT